MSDEPHHPPGDKGLLTKRRQFMAAIATGGVAATSGAGLADSADPPVDVGLGGGPMADELSHATAQLYRWTDEELPDPGVLGRYIHHTHEDGEGALYEDQGDSWERVPLSVGDLRSESLTTDQLSIGAAVVESGSTWVISGASILDDPDDVSSTSFVSIGDISGGLPRLDDVPDGMVLEGRFSARARVTDGGDGDRIYLKPRLNDDAWSGRNLDSLEISTDSDSFTTIDSGWVDISGDIPISSRDFVQRDILGRVDGGTGSITGRDNVLLLFRWRID